MSTGTISASHCNHILNFVINSELFFKLDYCFAFPPEIHEQSNCTPTPPCASSALAVLSGLLSIPMAMRSLLGYLPSVYILHWFVCKKSPVHFFIRLFFALIIVRLLYILSSCFKTLSYTPLPQQSMECLFS